MKRLQNLFINKAKSNNIRVSKSKYVCWSVGGQTGGKIGSLITNNKLYDNELTNNEGLPNLANPRLTPINTRE